MMQIKVTGGGRHSTGILVSKYNRLLWSYHVYFVLECKNSWTFRLRHIKDPFLNLK